MAKHPTLTPEQSFAAELLEQVHLGKKRNPNVDPSLLDFVARNFHKPTIELFILYLNVQATRPQLQVVKSVRSGRCTHKITPGTRSSFCQG